MPSRFSHPLLLCLLCGLVWCTTTQLLCGQTSAAPQETTQPPKATTEPDLTEGLLDLVKEPEATATPPSAKPSDADGPFTPSDVGLDGEDLGERSSSPLQSVRQSMLIAAGLLQRGSTGVDTQRLQSDIVQRLDDLISELEKKPKNQDPSEENQERQQERQQSQREQSQQQQQSEESTRQQATSSSEEESSETGEEPNRPGVGGKRGRPEVRVADPKALQEDVWGHLPERLRAQMQSRMVEQFLPSYREQIEAYFRALLEEPSEN